MLFLQSVLAQSQFCAGDNTFCVYGHQTNGNIVVHMYSNVPGWASFGIGTGMRGTQMYTFWKNSTGGCTLAQAYSTAEVYPVPNSGDAVTQIAPYLPAPSWATASCAFVRPRQQSRSQVNGNTNFVWAYGNSAPSSADQATARFTIHSRDGRGQADFTVNGPALPGATAPTSPSQTSQPSGQSTAAPKATTTVAPSTYDDGPQPFMQYPSNWSDGYNIYLHGILMFLAWGLFPFFGIYAARFSKKSPVWFKIHIASFTLTFLATVAGFLLVFLFNTPPHFKSWHEIIGLIVCIGMVFQIVLGIYIDRTFDAERGTIPIRDKIHWVLGRLLFFAGLVAIITGMQQYNVNGEPVNDILWWAFFIWIIVGDIALFFGTHLLKETKDDHHPKKKTESMNINPLKMDSPRELESPRLDTLKKTDEDSPYFGSLESKYRAPKEAIVHQSIGREKKVTRLEKDTNGKLVPTLTRTESPTADLKFIAPERKPQPPPKDLERTPKSALRNKEAHSLPREQKAERPEFGSRSTSLPRGLGKAKMDPMPNRN